MAEYFPLLERAISGLTEPTAEARRSIYERARGALIGQLRRMDPPVPEEDITRESAALDEAIARIEAGFDAHVRAPAAAPQAPAAAPPAAAPRAPSPAPVLPAPSPVVPPALPTAARVPPPSLPTGAPPVVPPPSRERPSLPLRPGSAAPGAAPVVPPARPPLGSAARLPPRGTRPVMALRPVAPVPERDAATPPPSAPPAEPPPRDGPEPETAPSFDDALATAERDAPSPAAEPAPAAARPRDGAGRPPAPRPGEEAGLRRPRIIAGLLAAALVMAGVGFTAYKLRDRPEQVAAARPVAVEAATDPSPGKVAGRAGVDAAAGADAATDAGAPPSSGAAVPAPVAQGSDAENGGASIPVAQRAALLVDAPDDPQRVRTYVGTVVWHLDSVNPGNGQPLASAVKADIDIPEAKLKVTMLLQKNPEPQLPASHTIEFHFLPQPGNTLGAVKQVNVPEMRRDDDAPTGDPLAGVPVAITDNYFLVGLTRGGAEKDNIRLMADRNWFDMSLLFTSGKLGKLTFEKGVSGQRVLSDALKAWK